MGRVSMGLRSKTRAPAFFTCDVNGFDPTTYDIPGRYFYARAAVTM